VVKNTSSRSSSGRPSGSPTTPSQEELAIPTPISEEAAYARVRVKALEDSIAEIKGDIKDIRSHRFTDFLWHLGALLAFGAAVSSLYFRIDDKISALSIISTKIDTKLESLLARIPLVPTPLPGQKP
jgi:hypothetical protein